MVKCTKFLGLISSKYPLATYETTCVDCGLGKIYYNGLTNIIGTYIREHD